MSAERTPLPTPIRPRPLKRLLQGYRGAEYIVQGFLYGFDLGYLGVPSDSVCRNNQSVRLAPAVARSKILSEVSLGRIAGPFSSPPLPNFICSPLSLREKSTPGSYRLLHNLSFPYDARAVNHNIPQDFSSLQYASVYDAIKILIRYDTCFMAKADIKEAYRLIPLAPQCYNLLGFQLEGEFFYDRCLPMGASSSCAIFEKFSDSLVFILKDVYKVKHVVKMLDDFLFIGETEYLCQYALDSFRHLCRLVGVPLAEDKTVEPSECLTFLGIQLDKRRNEASIPLSKVNAYRKEVRELRKKGSCTFKELKSLIGKLQFASAIVPSGRCFLRRLHDASGGLKDPYSQVSLTQGMKADLLVWEDFLAYFNGRALFLLASPLSSTELHMTSDSSKEGYGATFGSHFLVGLFPKLWQSFDIQTLELYPIFALVLVFGKKMANKSISIFCDNSAIVDILNKQTSKSKRIMCLLRPLILNLLCFNIRFRAIHLPGLDNTLCDSLSRQQVTPALLQANHMDPVATPIPAQFLPENWNLE